MGLFALWRYGVRKGMQGTSMPGLNTLALFAQMDAATLARYEKRCVRRAFSRGQMIIDQEEVSRDVRFITKGHVRIVARVAEGREVIFNDFGPGQFFGELAAIDGGVRSASVSAQSDVTLWTMPHTVFRELCHECPEVCWGVMEHMAKVVRLLSERLSEFTFLKARHRLYAELLRLSRDGDADNERLITPKPKQGDIADRISSRREIVSREMKELERAGIIKKVPGGLLIARPEDLSRLAAQGWLN